MKPLAGVVTLRTPVSRLKELFATDHVAIVKDGDQLAAIVTKIDLIDWLGTRVSVALIASAAIASDKAMSTNASANRARVAEVEGVADADALGDESAGSSRST